MFKLDDDGIFIVGLIYWAFWIFIMLDILGAIR